MVLEKPLMPRVPMTDIESRAKPYLELCREERLAGTHVEIFVTVF
jgi:hypothetical protein